MCQLQYVVLCRALIPMHADLRLAGTLPPLDSPHHMRANEWSMYREGVVLKSIVGEGSLLNVGLDKVNRLLLWRKLMSTCCGLTVDSHSKSFQQHSDGFVMSVRSSCAAYLRLVVIANMRQLYECMAVFLICGPCLQALQLNRCSCCCSFALI